MPMVIEKIVKKDLCIGCGMCAAICPDNLFKMNFNNFGEYNPFPIADCEKNCGLCLKVCPFADSGENEDTIGKDLYGSMKGIEHLPETGYYLQAYVGYSEKFRDFGASGGMATWVMEKLLDEKVVDYIVSVIPHNDSQFLFTYSISGNIKDLHTGTGSVYYPVELSEIIKSILKTPGKYAVIGLPCFIKALRLAQKKNVKLKDRILVTLGLTCGQLKNAQYTKYIAALSGVYGQIVKVHYRGKVVDKPANNYFFSCKSSVGKEGKRFWRDGISDIWINRWFTLNSCNYCDDIFAECADVTLMDAWLSPYTKDGRGTNLVLIRSPLIQNIINNGIDCHEIVLNHIPVQKIIRSQSGLIQSKREDLAYRIFLAQENMKITPIKRIKPERIKHYLPRLKIQLKLRIQNKSKLFFGSIQNQDPDIIMIQKKMKYDEIFLKILQHLDYVSIIKFIKRKLS